MSEPKPRRTRGDGAFFQRADGKWMGRVELAPVAGKRRYKWVSSVDRNTCIAKLKKLRADVDAGRIATTSNTTVEKWMTRWIDEIHSQKEKPIRPSTIGDYRSIIANHIVPAIGSKRLDKLTPEHVRGMHRDIGPSRTAVVAHVVLKKALKDAVREGLITHNVAEAVDKPIYKKTKRNGLSAPIAKHVIRTAIASRDESEATRVATAFLTGARRGELLGLEWDRVDLDNGSIDLSWQLQQLTRSHGCGTQVDGVWPCGRKLGAYCPQKRWDFRPDFEYRECYKSLLWTKPKSQAGERDVPLIPPLLVALKAMHANQGINPHGLVWHQPDGRPIDPRDDYDMWKGVFTAAGLIEGDETLAPHVVRHTTVTLLRTAGVDEATRMELVGHSSVDAQRIYAHADRVRHLEAMSNLAELLA